MWTVLTGQARCMNIKPVLCKYVIGYSQSQVVHQLVVMLPLHLILSNELDSQFVNSVYVPLLR